ncbi:hypothetical protein Bca52824_075373 [Brassica carinata]|uniref:Uncharacterized protein n=1 Tax=Brassica carinata TaxID=52824 RepID=A0A8X7TWB2_BRACI|nr:hypothetical protein Bca52824_075373 [Brassica carinata]
MGQDPGILRGRILARLRTRGMSRFSKTRRPKLRILMLVSTGLACSSRARKGCELIRCPIELTGASNSGRAFARANWPVRGELAATSTGNGPCWPASWLRVRGRAAATSTGNTACSPG